MVNMFIWYNNYKINKPFPPPWLYSFELISQTQPKLQKGLALLDWEIKFKYEEATIVSEHRVHILWQIK